MKYTNDVPMKSILESRVIINVMIMGHRERSNQDQSGELAEFGKLRNVQMNRSTFGTDFEQTCLMF